MYSKQNSKRMPKIIERDIPDEYYTTYVECRNCREAKRKVDYYPTNRVCKQCILKKAKERYHGTYQKTKKGFYALPEETQKKIVEMVENGSYAIDISRETGIPYQKLTHWVRNLKSRHSQGLPYLE